MGMAVVGLLIGGFLIGMGDSAEPAGKGEKPDRTKAATTIYDFTVKDIGGKDVELADYEGAVCLIVNVASR